VIFRLEGKNQNKEARVTGPLGKENIIII